MSARYRHKHANQSFADDDVGGGRFLPFSVFTRRDLHTERYECRFSAVHRDRVVVKVNDQLRIDLQLTVGNVQEEISIAAGAVQVETESTQLGDVIDSKKMMALPLNGRSYLDLLELQAGVVPVTSGSMQ